MHLEIENSTGNKKVSFKERFKSNWSKRWQIFLGLVIAHYAVNFLAGGGLNIFDLALFLNALIGSLIFYFIIVIVITSIKR